MSGTDDLIVWAEALGKHVRTIRRYASLGLIPGAIRNGARWQVPFSANAYAAAQERLIGYSRERQSTGWPVGREENAKLYTAAYALWLALTRQAMKEFALAQFYQQALFSGHGSLPRELGAEDEEIREQWARCLAFADANKLKRTALVAAYFHAYIEQLASNKAEARAENLKHRMRPFQLPVAGEVEPPGKRKPRRRWGGSGIDRVRKQVVELTKRPFPLRSVIQKWQWILGKRSIQRALVIDGLDATGEAFVGIRSRYCSRRSFYGWYSNEERRWAIAAFLKLDSER